MRGALLISSGMGIAVLGLQQAGVWGWGSAATWAVLGRRARAAARVRALRAAACPSRSCRSRLFADRAFLVDNVVLFLLSICFVPLFFFAEPLRPDRARRKLGRGRPLASSSSSSDSRSALAAAAHCSTSAALVRRSCPGCLIAAVGFYLWAESLDDLSFGEQWWRLAIAGVGVGLVLGPVSTDALNRAGRMPTYGAVTGLTQTVRNFGGSLGLAVLGSILVTQVVSKVTKTLTADGVPHAKASAIAHAVSGASTGAGSSSGSGSGEPVRRGKSQAAVRAVQADFASATKTVVLGMAGAMAVAFVVSFLGLPRGRPDQEPVDGRG